jgi:hypothetical protein
MPDEGAVLPASDWRPTPHAVEHLGTAYTSTVWQRSLAWFFWLTGVGYYFLVAHAPISAGAPGSAGDVFLAHVKALVMVVVAQAALALLYARLREHIDIGPGIGRIQTRVPDPAACQCRAVARSRGVVTGEDEGFVWIEGGTLYYKGLQAAFRLNAPDITPFRKWPRSERAAHDPTVANDRAHVRLAWKDEVVEFRFIERFDDHEARRRISDFRRKLHAWFREPEPASLESLLPPRGLHPSFASAGIYAYEAVFAGGVGMATAVVLVATQPPRLMAPGSESLLTATVYAGAALLFAISAATAVAQWRANSVRARLEAGTRV